MQGGHNHRRQTSTTAFIMYTARFTDYQPMAASRMSTSLPLPPPVCNLLPSYTMTKSDSVAQPGEYVGNIYLLQHSACVHIVKATRQGPLWQNTTSFTKPEVHNIFRCWQRRTEPRPRITRTWRTRGFFRADRQAHRHAHCNNSHAYLGEVKHLTTWTTGASHVGNCPNLAVTVTGLLND